MKPNKENYKIFYLEPYVYVFVDQTSTLLYDTSTGSMLDVKNSPDVLRTLKKTVRKKTLRSVRLSTSLLNHSTELAQFIDRVKNEYMGDLLNENHFKKKPAHLIPYARLQRDIKRLNKSSPEQRGLKLQSYIHELFIFINYHHNLERKKYRDAHKQFPYTIYKNSNAHLSFSEISKLLSELPGSALSTINILGGELFKHPEINKILDFLNRLKYKKRFYIRLSDWNSYSEKYEVANLENTEIEIFTDSAVDVEQLDMSLATLAGKSYIYSFLVESEDNISNVMNVMNKRSITNFKFRPFFNGMNLKFFEDNVFTTKEDLREQKIAEKTLLARLVMNPVNFGKLYILPDGEVHSNLNRQCVGNIKIDSPKQIVLKILDQEKSWTRTRKNVMPCKSCRFHALCPPITNYEYTLGKYNLCDIKKNV